jgi:hypothetical protein
MCHLCKLRVVDAVHDLADGRVVLVNWRDRPLSSCRHAIDVRPQPHQSRQGNDLMTTRKSIRVIAAGALLFTLVASAAPAGAQRIQIPNGAMPGRERERFVVPPAPQSTIGGVGSFPGNASLVVPKRSHSSATKGDRLGENLV